MASIAELSVAVLEGIDADPVLTLLVAGVIGVGDGEGLEGVELSFDDLATKPAWEPTRDGYAVS